MKSQFEKKVAFVFLLLGFGLSHLEAQITFQRNYGDTSHLDIGKSGEHVSNGGYIIAFDTDSSGFGYNDMGLMRTDDNGNVLWKKYFGSSGQDFSDYARETSDGGFILTGGWDGFTNDSIVLIKTDANGNAQWTHHYSPNTNRSLGQYVIQTSDGGFAVTGFVGPNFTENMFLLKTDGMGNQQWIKTYGGTGRDEGFCVHEISGNGFILSGSSYSSGSENLWLVRTNNNGDTLWTRTNGTPQQESGYKNWVNTDGTIVMVGFGNQTGGNVFLWKVDANGNTIWTRNYDDGGWENAYGVVQTYDGGFAIAGRSENPSHHDQAWLIRTDANGNLIWGRYFDSGYFSDLYDIIETSDGGFLLTGDRVDSSNYNSNIYLIKTGPEGYVNINENFSVPAPEFSVFPNPASSFSEIYFSVALPGRRIRLSTIDGKIIFDDNAESLNYRMNLNGISSGIYIISVISNEGFASKRIIVSQ